MLIVVYADINIQDSFNDWKKTTAKGSHYCIPLRPLSQDPSTFLFFGWI